MGKSTEVVLKKYYIYFLNLLQTTELKEQNLFVNTANQNFIVGVLHVSVLSVSLRPSYLGHVFIYVQSIVSLSLFQISTLPETASPFLCACLINPHVVHLHVISCTSSCVYKPFPSLLSLPDFSVPMCFFQHLFSCVPLLGMT